jgi:hypothetical protein
VSPPQRPRDRTGGESGEGGDSGQGGESGSGGRGGSAGRGGSGGRGGSSGSGGAGGSTEKQDAATSSPDASGGGGGTGGPDASPKLDVKLDGKRDANPNAAMAWEKLNLVLANCVYCHNDPAKRVDLQESGLYDRLVNKEAERVSPDCTNKMLVVPNDPMASLLYLKLAGTMPASCGERMPYKKPAVSEIELKMVADWINAGAPNRP